MQLCDLVLLSDVFEFVLEGAKVGKFVRSEEVEEVEKFLQVVLQRCAGEQQFIPNVVGVQHTEELMEITGI